MRTAIQILFKSSICFACTATKSERMNGYGLSFIFLCVLLYPLPICRPIAFTNQEGSCFSAHYKDLSAGMTMNARRLEHHSLEMLLPWVKNRCHTTCECKGMLSMPWVWWSLWWPTGLWLSSGQSFTSFAINKYFFATRKSCIVSTLSGA